MGRNDRLGVKPICTHVTDKLGMMPPDCIPNPYATGSAAGNNPANYVLPDYDAEAAFRDYGMDKPFNGMLSDDCEQVTLICSCSDVQYCSIISSHVLLTICTQTCYMCRTSLLSSSTCESCSCNPWPAPLQQDPVADFLGL